MAAHMLKARVLKALGSGSEVAELNVGWSSVELVGLNIRGPEGWPAARTLHADRVKIIPSLRSFLSREVHIASIIVENPYLSVVRRPGKLVILPRILEAERRRDNSSSRAVAIGEIILKNGTMDVFDTTVSQPPLKIRLERIEAVVRDVAPSKSQNRTRFDIAAISKGKTRDGEVKISAWVAAGGNDSSSHIAMHGVDLASVQPYLVKKGEARVDKGKVDLDIKSEVRNHRLDGTGKMIIRDLEFAPSKSYMGTFMGLSRSGVIAFLKDHDNAIHLDFTISGDIRHPDFQLNETLAGRVARGMAERLGVNIRGVAEGLGELGRKGLEGASGTADAVGSILRGLFNAGGSP
jgi:hypothetical protein